MRLLTDIVDEALGPMRLAVWLMTGFGVIALTLAAVGIYGVFSSFVGERTREIAVRLALGATPSDIRGLVVRRGVRLLALRSRHRPDGRRRGQQRGPSLLYEVSAFDVLDLRAGRRLPGGGCDRRMLAARSPRVAARSAAGVETGLMRSPAGLQPRGRKDLVGPKARTRLECQRRQRGILARPTFKSRRRST